MDHSTLVAAFRDKGSLHIKEGNGKGITVMKPELWEHGMENNWIYLLFDMFQIRTICEPFSEVSLDIVEYANKPTIYHSPANRMTKSGPTEKGILKFSLIKEPSWNKLLYQIAQPVIINLGTRMETPFSTPVQFPLYSPGTKEMYLGPEGDVKIIVG